MGTINGCHVTHGEAIIFSYTNIYWYVWGQYLNGESWKKIGWYNNYINNNTLHPSFGDLDSICIQYEPNKKPHCQISQLYKKNIFYLIHFTNYTNLTYNKNITLNLGNNIYRLRYIDYWNETITIINNTVNGSKFIFQAPFIPYNIDELVNIQSKYLYF